MDLDLAETPGELDLAVGGHLVAREDEHLPLEEGAVHGIEPFPGERGGEVEPGDLGSEAPGEGPQVEVQPSQAPVGVHGAWSVPVVPPARTSFAAARERARIRSASIKNSFQYRWMKTPRQSGKEG